MPVVVPTVNVYALVPSALVVVDALPVAVTNVIIGTIISDAPTAVTAFAAFPFESLKLTVKVAISPCRYEALSNDAVYVYASPAQRASNVPVVILPVAADV